ncbi:MAG: hypothetical protein NZ934_00740 [Hadesarchaea archaeon]|nr:hypothetical protein [Hadesarchaea archaeon]
MTRRRATAARIFYVTYVTKKFKNPPVVAMKSLCRRCGRRQECRPNYPLVSGAGTVVCDRFKEAGEGADKGL